MLDHFQIILKLKPTYNNFCELLVIGIIQCKINALISDKTSKHTIDKIEEIDNVSHNRSLKKKYFFLLKFIQTKNKKKQTIKQF